MDAERNDHKITYWFFVISISTIGEIEMTNREIIS